MVLLLLLLLQLLLRQRLWFLAWSPLLLWPLRSEQLLTWQLLG